MKLFTDDLQSLKRLGLMSKAAELKPTCVKTTDRMFNRLNLELGEILR